MKFIRRFLANTKRVGVLFKPIGLSTLLLVCCSTWAVAQNVSVNLHNVSLQQAITAIVDQTNYGISYNVDEMPQEKNVTINVKNVSFDAAMESCLKKYGFIYMVHNNTVVIQKVKQQKTSREEERVVKGSVLDNKTGEELIGVNVAAVRKGKIVVGTTTQVDGTFSLKVPEDVVLKFTYVGYKERTLSLGNQENIVIKLDEDENQLSEVVVNGYYNRKRESFTGSEISIKAEQLQDLGATNIMSTISAFNPSLRMTEQLEYGADPNRVPEMTLRGQSTFDLRGSAEGSRSNPNAPLYILDGVEVSAETVYDYDINRIDNITILKDASATAVYGSRGANGVIVMNTKRPIPGRIKVSFNANYTVSIPDLRDYNLMNAAEKLEFEKRAGVYVYSAGGAEGQLQMDKLYNARLQEVARGVNTYWLSQPVQTSLNQKYSAVLEGGDSNLRYQLNLRYDTNKGVMKKSGRDNYGISAVLDYNIGENFRVRNDLAVSNLTAKNSPYGSFSTYAQQNPYDRIYDENGEFVKVLSTNAINPMINASLPNKDDTKTTTWQDNFSLEWRFMNAFRLTSRLSYTKALAQSETFLSPNSPVFKDEADVKRRGKATYSNSTEETFDGNVMLSYYDTYKDDHTLNVTAGTNFTSTEFHAQGFAATGFLNDNLTNIYYAQQYAENSKPSSSSDVSRLVGFLVNANYGFKEKYYADFSFRTDGSSKFGSESRFAPFWSLGLAWNVDKESFMNEDLMTMKLRASIGTTGNINFASSQAITKYSYDPNNVYLDSWGATIQGYGNDKLKWQKTMTYNVGVDITLLDNRISFFGDVYRKLTDNLLLPMNVAPSTGFSYYTENVGKVENLGLEGRLQVSWLRKKEFSWSTTFSAFHNRNTIKQISNELQAMNERNNTEDESNVGGTVANQYENGNSTTAIYVVRSAGIDPATGNEVYIKRDGSLTSVYDYKDKVVVGDTEPSVNGNIINNIAYKGLNVYAVLTYRVGGKLYNSTLATKVEGANPTYNADKRVLYDRWKEPGDVAHYRRIDDNSAVYQTSRFVQDNNSLVLSNLSVTYTFPQRISKKWGCEYFKVVAATTDLFRLTSIKTERGTSYPFAQTFSLGINVRF